MSIIFIIVVYTHYSSIISSNELADLMRVPVYSVACTLAWNYDLFALLPFLAADVVVQLLEFFREIHNMDVALMSIVTPKGNYWRIVQGFYSVYIGSGLHFLHDDFWVFIIVLILVFVARLRLIVKSGLVKFGPFGKIQAIFVGIVASTLDCQHLIRIFVHLLIRG